MEKYPTNERNARGSKQKQTTKAAKYDSSHISVYSEQLFSLLEF